MTYCKHTVIWEEGVYCPEKDEIFLDVYICPCQDKCKSFTDTPGYRDAIKKGMGYDDSDLEDCCVNISTEKEEYPLSYIEFETKDLLGISSTRPDLTEGFIVLNKKYITSIAIVYSNDIVLDKKEKEDIMYI